MPHLNEFPPLRALHFSPDQEKRFQTDYAQRFLSVTRTALGVSVLLMVLFGLLDVWAAPNQTVLRQLWLIRYGLILPALSLGWLYSFHPTFPQRMQVIVSLVVLVAGFAIAAMVALTAQENAAFNTYYVGMILITLGAYTFMRLRFWYALVSNLLIFASYNVAALFFQRLLELPMGTSAFVTANFFFVTANFVGGFASYYLELYARRDFTQRQTIAMERAKVEQALQQEAAAALRASEAHYRSLIENSSDLISIVNQEGVYQYASPSFERVLGYRVEEMVGQPAFAFVHPDDIAAAQTAFAQLVTQPQGIIRIEGRLRHQDGSYRVIETSAKLWADEIRTPMNAVIGMTSLLLETELTAKQRDFVETIRTSGDSLLTIINDILDFSKIEAEKMELVQRPLDLSDCIESSLDLLAPRAAEKGLDLVYVMAEDVPRGILGDATRLRQILVNLVGNGVKFTEQGEVVVAVTSEQIGNGEQPYRLHFAVRDTGIGIAPDKMARLFQSFSQLDASLTRGYGGTGLGLAISKRLAELMGGTMWAESAGPEKGATFHFTILAESAPVPARLHLHNPRPELRGKRLLIVDDNPTNLQILCLQTEMWGMMPQCAAAPSHALTLLEQGHRFDLAILDMHIPEMDGLALAEMLRQHPSAAALPLIMLTSVGWLPDARLADRFAAFLTKPVKPSQLYDVLVTVLAERAPAVTVTYRPTSDRQTPLADQLPLRILLVEDVAVNQKFALQALEQMGYRGDVAANGLEALTAVNQQPYDVILMDVQMPEMDGLEATRHIHQRWQETAAAALPIARRPHIIAMTANALQGDREICLAAGMDDYISKPVYLEELRAALKRAGAAAKPKLNGQSLAHPAPVPILDETVIHTIRQRASGREMITLYLAEATQIMGDLRQAVEQGDAKGQAAAAHSLKGSSLYLGARQVVSLSAALEQAGRQGHIAAPEQLHELEQAFARTEEAFQQFS